jgi:hypothetical protein
MDLKLSVKSLNVRIPNEDVKIKLEGFEMNVKDLDLKEAMELAKEMMTFSAAQRPIIIPSVDHETFPPSYPYDNEEPEDDHTVRVYDFIRKAVYETAGVDSDTLVGNPIPVEKGWKVSSLQHTYVVVDEMENNYEVDENEYTYMGASSDGFGVYLVREQNNPDHVDLLDMTVKEIAQSVTKRLNPVMFKQSSDEWSIATPTDVDTIIVRRGSSAEYSYFSDTWFTTVFEARGFVAYKYYPVGIRKLTNRPFKEPQIIAAEYAGLPSSKLTKVETGIPDVTQYIHEGHMYVVVTEAAYEELRQSGQYEDYEHVVTYNEYMLLHKPFVVSKQLDGELD